MGMSICALIFIERSFAGAYAYGLQHKENPKILKWS
jgi:hypothetical protein